MYRHLVLLFITAVSSAPKGNSDITYVKLHPLTEPQAPARTHYRESRIENLPLTIPGNIAGTKEQATTRAKDSIENIEKNFGIPLSDNPKVDRVPELESSSLETDKNEDKDTKAAVKDSVTENERTKSLEVNAKRLNPKIRHSESKPDNLSDKHFSEKPSEENKGDIVESNVAKRSPDNPVNIEDQSESRISESQPLAPPETDTIENEENLDIPDEYLGISDPNRHIRSEDIASTIYDDVSDTTPLVTEKNESLEQLLRETEEYETRTRAPVPRFLSKLSYFQKNTEDGSVVTNFIERAGKRGFKSNCKCEKMWNCPKLQITVPRCPTDYFLCC